MVTTANGESADWVTDVATRRHNLASGRNIACKRLYCRNWNRDIFAIDAYDSCAACRASSSVLNCVVAAA